MSGTFFRVHYGCRVSGWAGSAGSGGYRVSLPPLLQMIDGWPGAKLALGICIQYCGKQLFLVAGQRSRKQSRHPYRNWRDRRSGLESWLDHLVEFTYCLKQLLIKSSQLSTVLSLRARMLFQTWLIAERSNRERIVSSMAAKSI